MFNRCEEAQPHRKKYTHRMCVYLMVSIDERINTTRKTRCLPLRDIVHNPLSLLLFLSHTVALTLVNFIIISNTNGSRGLVHTCVYSAVYRIILLGAYYTLAFGRMNIKVLCAYVFGYVSVCGLRVCVAFRMRAMFYGRDY